MSIFQLGAAEIWIKTNVPHKSCVRKQEKEKEWECVGVREFERTQTQTSLRKWERLVHNTSVGKNFEDTKIQTTHD